MSVECSRQPEAQELRKRQQEQARDKAILDRDFAMALFHTWEILVVEGQTGDMPQLEEQTHSAAEAEFEEQVTAFYAANQTNDADGRTRAISRLRNLLFDVLEGVTQQAPVSPAPEYQKPPETQKKQSPDEQLREATNRAFGAKNWASAIDYTVKRLKIKAAGRPSESDEAIAAASVEHDGIQINDIDTHHLTTLVDTGNLDQARRSLYAQVVAAAKRKAAQRELQRALQEQRRIQQPIGVHKAAEALCKGDVGRTFDGFNMKIGGLLGQAEKKSLDPQNKTWLARVAARMQLLSIPNGVKEDGSFTTTDGQHHYLVDHDGQRMTKAQLALTKPEIAHLEHLANL